MAQFAAGSTSPELFKSVTWLPLKAFHFATFNYFYHPLRSSPWVFCPGFLFLRVRPLNFFILQLYLAHHIIFVVEIPVCIIASAYNCSDGQGLGLSQLSASSVSKAVSRTT